MFGIEDCCITTLKRTKRDLLRIFKYERPALKENMSEYFDRIIKEMQD